LVGDDVVALPVVGESIGGPLPGWREVEFAIGRFVGDGDEGFETRVLPKLIGRGRDLRCGDDQAVDVAHQPEVKHEMVVRLARHPRLDGVHKGRWRCGMMAED